MTYEWPQGWVPIYCICDALIGGYRREDQPDLIHIVHECDPKSIAGSYVTVIHK